MFQSIHAHLFAGSSSQRDNNTLPTNPRMPFCYFSYGLPAQGGGPGGVNGGRGPGGPGTQGGLNGLRIGGLDDTIIGEL